MPVQGLALMKALIMDCNHKDNRPLLPINSFLAYFNFR